MNASTTCSVKVGDDQRSTCEREANHDGVHIVFVFESKYPIMYSREDPAQFAHNHCHTCYQPITEQNSGSGLASALYCKDHLGPVQETHRQEMTCKSCGCYGNTEMRNYSMMWHEADIHCGNCGRFLRYWDAG